MKEVNGKYNSALVFIDNVEQKALDQIELLCSQEFVQGNKIRIMPDVHSGAGCTIGTTMTITDKIIPNLVGVDIGCGMETIKIKDKHIEVQKLDKLIYEKIPSGFNIRDKAHKFNDEIELLNLRCILDAKLNINRAEKSLGTLGGGNHFIEADKDSEGNIYIVVHSGSRHLGCEVASYYQTEGYNALNKVSKIDIENLILEYKQQGKEKEIQSKIKELKKEDFTDIPRSLAYVTGTLFEDYIHDMKILQRFAELNRKAIMNEIIRGMKLDVIEEFTTIHNYIDTNNMILRKGAVSAQVNEKILIPINMRDGSLICIGKGNSEWNYSAPHGAGRLVSRTQAKARFTLSEYKKTMKDIYSTSVNKQTLDECPMAYKSMDDIVNNISDTAEIQTIIKPIYNFKAGEEEAQWKKF